MRLNYETCIVGSKCVLVPYRPCHVVKYHEWMKDPYLLEMTGSEPLPLEEEIAMQQSWRDDNQKCTFIVLAKDLCDFSKDGEETDSDFCQRNLAAMVGDVNLFFSEEEEDSDDDEQAETVGTLNKTPQSEGPEPQLQAELDIMIAEQNYRGNGLGKEASCLMMLYGANAKKIRRFFCKIKESNDASMAMFQKSLGFREYAYAAVFQEFELERKEASYEAMEGGVTKTLGDQFKWKQFSCPERDTP